MKNDVTNLLSDLTRISKWNGTELTDGSLNLANVSTMWGNSDCGSEKFTELAMPSNNPRALMMSWTRE